MSFESKKRESGEEKSPLREEYDRIIAACAEKRGLLEQAVKAARTSQDLKFAVRLGSVEGRGVGDIGTGEYITSNVDNKITAVEEVHAAIDQYEKEQRWVGYGGQIPPFVGDKLRQLFEPKA